MMDLFTKRGQSTAEYAVLFGLVVAVAITMQTYVKRSLQGGAKFAVDNLKATTGQYEPYYLKSAYQTRALQYEETEEAKLNGEVVRELGQGKSGAQQTVRSGQQVISDTSMADPIE